MSDVDEESSCSLPENGDETRECEGGKGGPPPISDLSFFHVQPLSLSQGYESMLQSAEYRLSLQELEKGYGNSGDRRKSLGYRKGRVLAGGGLRMRIIMKEKKDYAKWLDFKKPLDERRLCQAVSMNDTASVIHLLNQGVSADCHDNLQRSPLHLAACKGYTHIVRILLDAGADVNSRDPIGNTPLHLAACTNHIDVVLMLLQAGSDGLSIDKLGRSPLQLAQSKLKILQKSSVPDQEIRNQVSQVIELLLMFTKEGPIAEQLTDLKNRLKTAESRAEVDTELRGLLDSLGTLSISGQT